MVGLDGWLTDRSRCRVWLLSGLARSSRDGSPLLSSPSLQSPQVSFSLELVWCPARTCIRRANGRTSRSVSYHIPSEQPMSPLEANHEAWSTSPSSTTTPLAFAPFGNVYHHPASMADQAPSYHPSSKPAYGSTPTVPPSNQILSERAHPSPAAQHRPPRPPHPPPSRMYVRSFVRSFVRFFLPTPPGGFPGPARKVSRPRPLSVFLSCFVHFYFGFGSSRGRVGAAPDPLFASPSSCFLAPAPT